MYRHDDHSPVRRHYSVLRPDVDTAHETGNPYRQGLDVPSTQEEGEDEIIVRNDERQDRGCVESR
ncbi:MAG: hypothetical protein WD492_09970 [Alkalispirochaeta sp.]